MRAVDYQLPAEAMGPSGPDLPVLPAPGEPGLVLADGRHLGWTTARGVWVQLADRVRHFSCPEPFELVVSPATWTVSLEGRVLRLDLSKGEIHEQRGVGARVRAGSHWTCRLAVPRTTVTSLDGRPVPHLPDGALEPHPLPWPDGPGLVWTSGRHAFRLDPQRGPRLIGLLPSAPDGIRAGPGGSAAFTVAERLFAAPPFGPLVELDAEPLLEEVCFDHAGRRLLAGTEEGVAVFDLHTGKVTEELCAAVVTVGFAPEPLVFDDEAGVVCALDGGVRLGGLLGEPG